MSAESSSLFKVFRVLWFPVSVNAVLLGALATFLFWLVTFFASWCVGGFDLGYTRDAAHAFPSAVGGLLTDGDWPGYDTEEVAGNIVHAARAGEELSLAAREAVGREEKFIQLAFRQWTDEQLAALRTEDAQDAEKVREVQARLARTPARYRVVFAFQIVAFFVLLATLGVAICRCLAVRVARDEYCTLGEAWRYAWDTKVTGLLFPAAVLLPLFFLAAMNFVAGSITAIPVIGGALGLILIPLAYVGSALIFLIGGAGALACGLVPSAIAIERKGTYDCLGKAFNYLFARPLPLLLYFGLVAVFLGFLHETLVEGHFLERILLATSDNPWWGGQDYEAMVLGDQANTEGFFATIWTFFHGLIHLAYRLLLWGVLVSFALGSQVAIFLIMRREIDGLDYGDLAAAPSSATSHVPPPAPAGSVAAASSDA